MNWADPGEDRWEGGIDDPDRAMPARWPLHWRGLCPPERWIWFEHLWSEVCMLRDRFCLAIRAGWWQNEVQLEALAAFSAWVACYDSGDWDDPPGKLALLYDLERVSALLRDGAEPFHPERDRAAFVRHLMDLGCQRPPVPRYDRPRNGHDALQNDGGDSPGQ